MLLSSTSVSFKKVFLLREHLTIREYFILDSYSLGSIQSSLLFNFMVQRLVSPERILPLARSCTAGGEPGNKCIWFLYLHIITLTHLHLKSVVDLPAWGSAWARWCTAPWGSAWGSAWGFAWGYSGTAAWEHWCI